MLWVSRTETTLTHKLGRVEGLRWRGCGRGWAVGREFYGIRGVDSKDEEGSRHHGLRNFVGQKLKTALTQKLARVGGLKWRGWGGFDGRFDGCGGFEVWRSEGFL